MTEGLQLINIVSKEIFIYVIKVLMYLNKW